LIAGFLACARWHPACCSGEQDVMMSNELSGSDALRYLDADHVKHPSGTFADLTIFSPEFSG